jgi:CheY-like chemotaxis protein/KaiC/GvpD/RAD55 family RecA-like ATPase
MTKILLADDEKNIRELGGKLLREAGYKVVIASNGNEAIEKALAERPDLVITDVKMPEKTGFEVCKALRSDPVLSNVPILILSALGDEYNKITGFEGGADDYLTKPFKPEILKERISMLLAKRGKKAAGKPSTVKGAAQEAVLEQILSGIPSLDKSVSGGLPKGSNILLIGPLGKGKSTFCRKFISRGLERNEKCLYVAVDDDPNMVRKELGPNVKQFEGRNILHFIDAYSWSSGHTREGEKFSIEGVLELDQLSGLIADAGAEIGQSVQKKEGGRRVIDSISSLLVNFEIPIVQKFLSQVGRTATAFGGVTTLFVLEEGSVPEQVVNNVKYLMDGIIEFKEDYHKKKIRVANMKWIKYEKEWIEW